MTRAKKIIDELKSVGSDNIDDKLNSEETILQDILQKRRLGDGASLQTASGAMVNINALSTPTPEEEDKPAVKTTTATDVISAATSLGGV